MWVKMTCATAGSYPYPPATTVTWARVCGNDLRSALWGLGVRVSGFRGFAITVFGLKFEVWG